MNLGHGWSLQDNSLEYEGETVATVVGGVVSFETAYDVPLSVLYDLCTWANHKLKREALFGGVQE